MKSLHFALFYALISTALCAYFFGFNNELLLSQEPMTEEHFCAILNLTKDCLAHPILSPIASSVKTILGEKRGTERARLLLDTLQLLEPVTVTFGTSEVHMAVEVCKVNLEELLKDPLKQKLINQRIDLVEDNDNRINQQMKQLTKSITEHLDAASKAVHENRPESAHLHLQEAADKLEELKKTSKISKMPLF